MNLLSNAVKYTSEGGKIVLDIDEKPSARDGFMTLQIRVSDNGIGISKEYVPYIFSTSEMLSPSFMHLRVSGAPLRAALLEQVWDFVS